jgi:NAD(P)-dependent dehydrogenase (short-subunit alcohol dehydrogenase family)
VGALVSLSGQRVLVVGGSSGMGLAVAHAARDRGAEVIVASRAPQRAGEALTGLRAVALDVTDEQSVSGVLAELEALDHLVCTAASGFPAGLFRAPTDAVRGLMESKFWGQYHCARAAAPLITQGGSITFTSGIRSRRPTRGTEAFTVVNMAVEGMARALAVELAPVRVNAVAPGTVETPVFDFMPADVRAQRLRGAADQTTVGRVGQPAELAEVFLMCMTNGFLSGTVIDADGGAMLA